MSLSQEQRDILGRIAREGWIEWMNKYSGVFGVNWRKYEELGNTEKELHRITVEKILCFLIYDERGLEIIKSMPLQKRKDFDDEIYI